MSMVELKYEDREVLGAIMRLETAGGNLKPAFEDIGEYLTLSTKQRFATGQAPDGTPWAPNTEATMIEFLRRKGGDTVRRKGEKSTSPYLRKDGRLNKRGADLITGKRPLIGETKRLSNEIHYHATATSVEVGSPLEQAAVMQLGAEKGAFGRTQRGAPIPWGDIPGREYLGLSGEDKVQVLNILGEHLEAALAG